MHRLGHVDAALACQQRGVDHVGAGHYRAEQAGQDGGAERAMVELGGQALVFDGDAAQHALARLGHLAGESAKQAAEFHVRPQAGRVLGRDGRHVDGVGDRAGGEEVAHLFGDLKRDVFLCLGGGRTQMRRADDVFQAEERALDGRFGFEDVECGAGDMAGFYRVGQGGFVDQAAAGAVDDADALSRLGQGLARQHVASGFGERGVQRDDLRPGQQVVELDLFDADVERALFGEVRVVGDDAHAQADGAVGDDRADIAAANQAERLAGQFHAHEAVLFPLAGFGGGAGFWDLAGEGEHHGDGVLGGGDGVAVRGVHHHDAGGGGGFDVNIVHTDAGPADHLEVAGGVEQFARDLGCGADGEAVIRADDGAQFSGREAGFHVDLDAAAAEDRHGGGGELVRDQNLCHALQASFTVSYAQSSHGRRAMISLVSTVAPPQMRRPGGASR